MLRQMIASSQSQNQQQKNIPHYQRLVTWYNNFIDFLETHKEFSTLRNYYPKKFDDSQKMGPFLDSMMHVIYKLSGDPRHLQVIINAIRKYQELKLGLQFETLALDSLFKERLIQFFKNGNTPWDPLTQTQLQEMVTYFKSQPVIDQNTKNLENDLHKIKTNLALFPTTTVVKCPHLMTIANDPKVLALVESYLGAVPTINVVTAWWSFEEREAARDAQLFHLDYDDYKFCKLFIYLTDVDEEAGPHVYINGTHRSEIIEECYKKSGVTRDVFVKWYGSQLRKTDEEVEKYISIKPSHITGSAGSVFFVDTKGIHKGLLPKSKRRLVCQVTYGVTPRPQEALTVVSHRELGQEGESLIKGSRGYINRLFLE